MESASPKKVQIHPIDHSNMKSEVRDTLRELKDQDTHRYKEDTGIRRLSKVLHEAAKDVQNAEMDERYEDEFEIEYAVDVLLKDPARRPTEADVAVDATVMDERRRRATANKKHKTKGLVLQHIPSKISKNMPAAQRRILASTLIKRKTPPKGFKDIQNRIYALAEPKADSTARDKLNRFANFDDVANCVFKPKICSKKERKDGNDDDAVQGEANVQACVRTMEVKERSKQTNLQRTRAEKEYLAKVDKKECPECGSVQTYAEVIDKRKKCTNCAVDYKSTSVWGDIRDEFIDRLKRNEEECVVKQAGYEAKYCPPFRVKERLQYDSDAKTVKRMVVLEKKWSDVEADFYERMKKDQAHRAANTTHLREKYDKNACTFQPQLSEASQQYTFEPFNDRMTSDINARQARHQEYEEKLYGDDSKASKPAEDSVQW